MNRNLLWRGLLILAIVVAAVAATFPLKEKINLGLDLQGGMHLVLQVHTEDALRAEADSDMGLLLQQAKEEDVTGLSGRRTSDTAFEITGLTPATRDTVSDLAGRFLGGWSSNFSDQRATFSMNADYANQIRQMAVTQEKKTID